MSDSHSFPVRRIGTRAAMRQEASNMVESDAATAAEPAPPATPTKTPATPTKTPATPAKTTATPTKTTATPPKTPATLTKTPATLIKIPATLTKTLATPTKTSIIPTKTPIILTKSSSTLTKTPIILTKSSATLSKTPIILTKTPFILTKTSIIPTTASIIPTTTRIIPTTTRIIPATIIPTTTTPVIPKTTTPPTADPSTTPDTDSSNTDAPDADTLDDSSIIELKVEPKMEPMDTSPPPEPTTTADNLPVTLHTTPLITTATLQLRENMLLQSLGPSPFTGRKRKANFSNEETETLVKDVVTHFSALYGSEALRTESTRRNQRRSELWTEIQKHVNELGYTPRSIDDLKHKWRDLRLEVKRKITQKKSGDKAGDKVSPAPGVPPIIDTKLTAMEDLVASTIGHHCTLDGEQEGMFMEPGVPRQSIFFTCRGPGGSIGEIGSDMVVNNGSPRPTPEISVMPPLVNSSPATQLSFIRLTEDTENGERDMDVTPTIQIKTFPENWTTLKEVGTLVTTQKLIPASSHTILTAPTKILTVKQEVLPAQPVFLPLRCESQNSIASSPEGSTGNPTGQPECNTGGSSGCSNGSPATSVVKTDEEMVQLKVENCEADSLDKEDKTSPAEEDDRGNWQENQEEWERQSQSPHSEMAPEDSLPSSSSQDGDPSSGGELPANGDCTFDPDDPKYRNMNRLLELEEQWDRLYHRELGIWEEDRVQQQQQRNQDRELQQQLLGVLTDIRDELRQLRQERAEARQNQALSNNANGSASVTDTSPTPTPKPSAESPTETPAKSTQPPPAKRRGRPRILRATPEPDSKS